MPANLFESLPPKSQEDIVLYMARQQRIRELDASNAALKRQYVQLRVNKLQADAMAQSPEASGDEHDDEGLFGDHSAGTGRAKGEGSRGGGLEIEVEDEDESEVDSEDEGVASGIYRARPSIKPSFAMNMVAATSGPDRQSSVATSSNTAAKPLDNRPAAPPIMWSQMQLISNAPAETQSYHSLESIVNMAEELRGTRHHASRRPSTSLVNSKALAPSAAIDDNTLHPRAAPAPQVGLTSGPASQPTNDIARHVPLGADGRYHVDFSNLGPPPSFEAATSPPSYFASSQHGTDPSVLLQTFTSSRPDRHKRLSRDSACPWQFQRPGCLTYHLFGLGERTTPDHFPRHTQMMDKLLDPRSSEANREFPIYAEDNFAAGQVVSLHRLPPAAEVQRMMLWSFVRIPDVPHLGSKERSGLARKVYYLTKKEKLHAEEAMCYVSIRLENMDSHLRRISSAQLKRERANEISIQPLQFVDTALGQELIETYMQLEHGHMIMQLVSLCAEIDVITAEKMIDNGVPQQCGPQFHFILLDRVKRKEWISMEVAIEVARAVWRLGKQINHEKQNPMLTASIFIRGIAYLLPYFPSRWLMEPWEARLNGLAHIYIGILTDLGFCLSVMRELHQTVYRIYAVIEQISGLNAQEHLASVELLLRSLENVPRFQHRDILRGTEKFEDIKSYSDRLHSEVQHGHDSLYKRYHNWHINGILAHKLRWYPGDLSDILQGNKARTPFWQLDKTPAQRAVAVKWNTWAARIDTEIRQWYHDIERSAELVPTYATRPDPAQLDHHLETLAKMPQAQADAQIEAAMQLALMDMQAAPMERTGRGGKGIQRQQRQQEAREDAGVMVAEQLKDMVRKMQGVRAEADDAAIEGASNVSCQDGKAVGVESQLAATRLSSAVSQTESVSDGAVISMGSTDRGRTLEQGKATAVPLASRPSSHAVYPIDSSGDEAESATIAQRPTSALQGPTNSVDKASATREMADDFKHSARPEGLTSGLHQEQMGRQTKDEGAGDDDGDGEIAEHVVEVVLGMSDTASE